MLFDIFGAKVHAKSEDDTNTFTVEYDTLLNHMILCGLEPSKEFHVCIYLLEKNCLEIYVNGTTILIGKNKSVITVDEKEYQHDSIWYYYKVLGIIKKYKLTIHYAIEIRNITMFTNNGKEVVWYDFDRDVKKIYQESQIRDHQLMGLLLNEYKNNYSI